MASLTHKSGIWVFVKTKLFFLEWSDPLPEAVNSRVRGHAAAAQAAPGHMDPCTVCGWFHGITGVQCDVNLRGARVDSRGSLTHAAANASIYR